MRLIPAIDLRGGGCVRLLRGDFNAETRYAALPAELLGKYRGYGADWLHVVDLDAARDGGAGNRAAVAVLAGDASVRVQLGGGLRDRAALDAAFELGAARAVIGSAAVTKVSAVRQWLGEFGAERLTLAFDVRLDGVGVPRVATHGWREQTSLCRWDALAAYEGSSLVHVLCTDVSRDGALGGPNLELYREAHARFPALAWQASGGIRDARDLQALADTGVAAAISGKALLDDLIPPEELRPFLPNA
jgi:phosphoribosylformimino-5-aminoimidazole carboxamide ribotide isomerase